MKRQRILAVCSCLLFVFMTIFSLFYVASEENHHCTGEDCPICICIHQAEQLLHGNGGAAQKEILVVLFVISFAAAALVSCMNTEDTTPVGQKVRMNH